MLIAYCAMRLKWSSLLHSQPETDKMLTKPNKWKGKRLNDERWSIDFNDYSLGDGISASIKQTYLKYIFRKHFLFIFHFLRFS